MTKQTTSLHPRNIHQGRYDLPALVAALPALKAFIMLNPRGEETINFSDEKAVLCLNQALLAHHYQIQFWQIPTGYLCPPIPGRADYIHCVADLMAQANNGKVPEGKSIKAIDIGTGANCIYPLIGNRSYGWQFTASDIDPVSVQTANAIVQANTCVSKQIKVLLQKQPSNYFTGIINPQVCYAVTLCNPPFHTSMQAAQAGTARKLNNLARAKQQDTIQPVKSKSKGKQNRFAKVKAGKAALNFGGQKAELWCEGGELRFIQDMMTESKDFAEQVCWFTSLVSKGENLAALQQHLTALGVTNVEVVPMAQGQKISRLIAWSFMSPSEQKNWMQQVAG